MKRLTFIGLVSGVAGAAGVAGRVARAQQWKECKPEPQAAHICTSEMKPALNNQCPVCGTMADAYNRPMREDSGMPKNCKPINDVLVSCDPPKMMAYGPTERVVRCRRCNAAFFVDSEDTK